MVDIIWLGYCLNNCAIYSYDLKLIDKQSFVELLQIGTLFNIHFRI